MTKPKGAEFKVGDPVNVPGFTATVEKTVGTTGWLVLKDESGCLHKIWPSGAVVDSIEVVKPEPKPGEAWLACFKDDDESPVRVMFFTDDRASNDSGIPGWRDATDNWFTRSEVTPIRKLIDPGEETA